MTAVLVWLDGGCLHDRARCIWWVCWLMLSVTSKASNTIEHGSISFSKVIMVYLYCRIRVCHNYALKLKLLLIKMFNLHSSAHNLHFYHKSNKLTHHFSDEPSSQNVD